MKSNNLLIEMNTKLSKIDNMIENLTYPKNWMGIQEAAQYSELSVSTLRRAIVKGYLKASRSTGKLLLRRMDIDRWLNG